MIFWGFEVDCDYEDMEMRDYCDGGFLRDVNEYYFLNRDGLFKECFVCSKKRFIGVGLFIEVFVLGL